MSILILFAMIALLALFQAFGFNIMNRDEWITCVAVILSVSFAILIWSLIDYGVIE